MLHGTHYSDLCYGYNAFWRRCLPQLNVDIDGFEVETLINLRAAKSGLRVTEVASFELDRIHGQSNLKTFRDGWRVLGTILREWVPQAPPDRPHAAGPARGRRATRGPTHLAAVAQPAELEPLEPSGRSAENRADGRGAPSRCPAPRGASPRR